MDSAAEALERLCDPVHEVSAHYLVREDGAAYQLVSEDARAWHAGQGAWGACDDLNSASIGIEISNDGLSPFAQPQILALSDLLRRIMARWEIPPERVIGHSDLAPGRKKDPGVLFPWAQLAFVGLAAWPDFEPSAHDFDHPADVHDVLAALHKAGYTAKAKAKDLIAAFRQRYQPRATGPATQADLKLAQALARDFPVDRANRYA